MSYAIYVYINVDRTGERGERERVLTISIVTTEIYHKVSLQSLYNPVLALDKNPSTYNPSKAHLQKDEGSYEPHQPPAHTKKTQTAIG